MAPGNQLKSNILVLDEVQAGEVRSQFPTQNGLLEFNSIAYALIWTICRYNILESTPKVGSQHFYVKLMYSLFEEYILKLTTIEWLKEWNQYNKVTSWKLDEAVSYITFRQKINFSICVHTLYDNLLKTLKDLDPWKCLEEFYDVDIINAYREQLNEPDPNKLREKAQNAYIYKVFYYSGIDTTSQLLIASKESHEKLLNDAIPEYALKFQKYTDNFNYFISSVTSFFGNTNPEESKAPKTTMTFSSKNKQD